MEDTNFHICDKCGQPLRHSTLDEDTEYGIIGDEEWLNHASLFICDHCGEKYIELD